MPIECDQFWQVLALGIVGGFVSGASVGVMLGQEWAHKSLWPQVEHWRDEFWRSAFGKPYEGE